MKAFTTQRPMRERILSKLLAMLMIFGLVPITGVLGHAAGLTMTNHYVNRSLDSGGNYIGKYNSPNLTGGSNVSLRGIPVTLSDGSKSWAFCNDHGKSLTSGMTYTQDTSYVLPEALKPFLNFFYYYTLVEDVWSDLDKNFATGYLNTIIWLSREGKFTDYNDPAQMQLIANERELALGQIDPSWAKGTSLALYESFVAEYKTGGYGEYDYYLFVPASGSDQGMITATPKAKEDYYTVYVCLSKVDENNTPLDACTFGIYATSEDAKNGTNKVGEITSTNDKWSYSGLVTIDTESTTLYIKELTAKSGYQKDETIQSVAVSATANATKETAAQVGGADFSFKNTTHASPEGVIVKVDAITGAPLAGTHLRIQGTSDKGHFYDKSHVTNSKGEVELQWNNPDGKNYIEPGEYTVTEVKASDGYVLDATQVQKIRFWIDNQGNPQHSGPIVFYNFPETKITFQKEDASGNGLSEAKFLVLKDGLKYTEFTTNDSGGFVLDGLTDGYYNFIETAAPAGYLLPFVTMSGIRVEVTQAPANGYTLVMKNYEYPEILIEKRSADTNEPLAGAQYEVKIDAQTLGTFVTNEAGMIVIDYPIYGKFLDESKGQSSWTVTVTEIAPPPGYFLADPEDLVQTNELRKGQTLSPFVFKNKGYPAIEILKLDSVTGKPVANAIFDILIDGTYFSSLPSGEDGKIRIDYDTYGKYLSKDYDIGHTITVEEKTAPNGYFLAADNIRIQTKEITTGTSLIQFTFENQPLPDVQVTKKDGQSGELLAGATFLLKSVSTASGATYNKELTTGASGIVAFKAVPEGVYHLSEKSPPSGYVGNDTVHTITVTQGCDQLFTFEYKNDKKPNLTIYKVDSVTGSPVKGALFQVWGAVNASLSGELRDLGKFYSDENGEIKLRNQEVGWVRVQELEPASGYAIKDPSSQDVFLEAGKDKTVTFENVPLSALVIRKIDSETGLPVQGAAFRVRYLGGTSGSGGTIIFDGVTSTAGSIVLTGLKAGTYIAEEYRAAPGYELSNPSSKTAYLSGKDQDVVELVFENAHKGGLVIKKLDSVTKQPLAGATFKVTDSSGGVIGPNNGEYSTDAEGLINIGEDLPVGSTIIVQEIKAPEGYVLDTTAQNVKIRENVVHSLTFYNSPKSGLQIIKIDSVTKQPIKGAKFTIYKKSGDVIGTYESDKDGLIIVDKLNPGWVEIVETKAPGGYILDDIPKDVEIKTNQFIKVTFENVPQGGLQIIKLDEETRRPIPNVEFAVAKQNGERIGTYRTDSKGIIRIPDLPKGWYVVSEVKSAGGYLLDDKEHRIEVKDGGTAALTITNRKASSILIRKIDSVTGKGICGVSFLISDANNNPMQTVTSDQNGYVYVPDLLDGKYHVREIEAAKGYILDTGTKTFYIRYGSTSEIEWKNTPEMGQIQITKKSADANPINGFPAGALLADAVFEVYDHAGNKVDTIKTDKNGWAATKTLPIGRYTIREVQAPAYYSAVKDVINAEIEFSGQIVRLEVRNTSVYTNVSVTKRGYTEVVPGQQIKYTFSNIGNNSTVPLDSFYWRDTLPTDAVRLDKIITGTWNARLSYKIVFKTNTNANQRTLADNLSTDKVYTVDASPAALGLASNEFVTEYMVLFGRVPAGFKQVEAPYIFCKVLTGLSHEYRFTNKTDVGGLWGKQWIMANDRWVSVVYSKTTPSTLPRTGY